MNKVLNSRNFLVTPVLKWVGGKRQLLEELVPLLPQKIEKYCEPFVGGGALFFKLQPSVAYINDINKELIRVYEVIRNDVEPLIELLEKYRNQESYYYNVRGWDRNYEFYSTLSDIEKAARTIYLNKTCYNGLYRVNASGQFNTPFGHYRNPDIVTARNLRAVSFYLQNASIKFTSLDYEEILDTLPKDTFVYFDPPYDPVSNTSNFTSYSKERFSRENQIRLKECCDELNSRGIQFMLSNSATDFIKKLYSDYNIKTVYAKRSINSNPLRRGKVGEVIIRNYE